MTNKVLKTMFLFIFLGGYNLLLTQDWQNLGYFRNSTTNDLSELPFTTQLTYRFTGQETSNNLDVMLNGYIVLIPKGSSIPTALKGYSKITIPKNSDGTLAPLASIGVAGQIFTGLSALNQLITKLESESDDCIVLQILNEESSNNVYSYINYSIYNNEKFLGYFTDSKNQKLKVNLSPTVQLSYQFSNNKSETIPVSLTAPNNRVVLKPETTTLPPALAGIKNIITIPADPNNTLTSFQANYSSGSKLALVEWQTLVADLQGLGFDGYIVLFFLNDSDNNTYINYHVYHGVGNNQTFLGYFSESTNPQKKVVLPYPFTLNYSFDNNPQKTITIKSGDSVVIVPEGSNYSPQQGYKQIEVPSAPNNTIMSFQVPYGQSQLAYFTPWDTLQELILGLQPNDYIVLEFFNGTKGTFIEYFKVASNQTYVSNSLELIRAVYKQKFG
jgi:hypothetical protein